MTSVPFSPVIVGIAVVYLAAVLAIGLWSARRTRTPGDFFVAGRRLGPWVTGLAMMSSAFSGFVFLGGPGLTYRLGIASLMIVLPIGITSGMLCWTVGRRLCVLAARREIYTVPDVVDARYASPAATGLAAVAVLAGSVAYLGLQLRALGVLLGSIFAIESASLAIAIGLATILVYSVLGGMIAGVYTDVLQGGWMLLAAIAVFVHAVRTAGGWTEMTGSIAAAPEPFGQAFLEPLGKVPPLTAFGFFFVFCVGVLGQPQLLHKFFMLRDVRALRWMPLVLGWSQALCLLIWLGLGLAVPALVAQGRLRAPASPDDAAPAFLLAHAPELLTGLVFAGILAAIMSTADSFLNIGSAALVRDLPRAFGRPLRDELSAGRAAVIFVAALAGLLAWLHGDLIALLGTFAFGIFGAALTPAIAVGLNWSGATREAAIASIATGLGLTLVLELLPETPLASGALPAAASLAASFTVFFAVSFRTRKRPVVQNDKNGTFRF